MKPQPGEWIIRSGCEHGLEIRGLRAGLGDENHVMELLMRHHCGICGAAVDWETADGENLEGVPIRTVEKEPDETASS